jgi:Na+/melibiose symporter-like transporter
MAGLFNYNTKLPDVPEAIHGFRVCSGIVVGLLFAVCCFLLTIYKLNKRLTLEMASELAERRKQFQQA